MRRRRISIDRRARKIGFLGKGMAVPSRQRSDIAHALALRIGDEKISTSDSECKRYREDVTHRPEMLRSIFSRTPEVIALPDSGQCVADILDICIEERTPAVPRGAGSVGLGGAMPVKGGVVIDVSRMAQVLSIDKAERTVTAEAGCTWKNLEQELRREDLCLRCYPSSAPLGTVGGWMSTGGYGIGTHREGRFHKQVTSMEVALASGLLVTSSQGEGRYAIGSFAGTEGQVGVITKLTLPVKVMPERRACYLVRLRREEDGFQLLRQLADSDDPPFFTQLVSGSRSRLLHEKAGFPTGEGGFISVIEEGDAHRVSRFDETIKRLAQAAGLDLDDGDDAASVWTKRYSYLELVSGGAVALAGEIVTDPEKAPALAVAITRSTNKRPTMLYECQLVDRGRALFAVGIRGDGGSASGVIRDVLATGYIMDVGVRAGGRPYGIGLWNSAYSRRILGKNYKNLRLVKTEIDRLGLLNPGKLFSMTTNRGFRVPGWMYRSAVRIAARF